MHVYIHIERYMRGVKKGDAIMRWSFTVVSLQLLKRGHPLIVRSNQSEEVPKSKRS